MSTRRPRRAGDPYARLSLGANTIWNVGGQVAYAATQWGILVLLTKWTDPATLGVFALSLSINTPIYAFLNLNLRSVQATDTEGGFRFADYVGHRVASSLSAQVVVQVVAWWVMEDGPARQVCMLVGLAKGVEALSDICYGLFQRRERMDVIGRSIVIRGSVALVAFAALLAGTGDLRAALVGQLAAWTLVLVAHDIPWARTFADGGVQPRFDRGVLTRITRLALPLGVVLLLGSLSYGVPRWVVEARLGAHELGIFAALAYMVQVGQKLMHAVTHAAVPRLAQRFAAGDLRGFAVLGGALCAGGAAIGAAGVGVAALVGEQLLTVLYTAEYAGRDGLFVVVMLAGGVGFVTRTLLHLLTAARRFRSQVPMAVLDVATIGVGCLVLVPAWGLVGAAWGWVFAQVAGLVLGSALLGVAMRQRAAVVAP